VTTLVRGVHLVCMVQWCIWALKQTAVQGTVALPPQVKASAVLYTTAPSCAGTTSHREPTRSGRQR
jgi:hypothetical protein